jgi:copper homeostasis protein
MFLELACFNPDSALIALHAGADRIELCANQHLGGTTPPIEWLESIRAEAAIMDKKCPPIFAMIRPRGGTDYNYTSSEFEAMQAEITRFKTLVDGFVFGILDAHRCVDFIRTRQLVLQARPLPCTFHRAIDQVPDLERALGDVMMTGCRAILSSGGKNDALEGRDMLGRLVRQAAGRRIEIIPGGGVRASNLEEICRSTGAVWFHSSAALPGREYADEAEIEAMKRVLSADGLK